ncbi:MAG: right-handed parallel beta-helix repeat-containing protein [Candidatus Binatia bacterium]|nr:right-handed parallel beta-helix repeat-containing protein [Candidatus Binatia bacterium]
MPARMSWSLLGSALYLLVLLEGCGGGGNGGPAVTPATPTRTPTRTLRPGEPTFTPTRTVPPPSPTPTLTPVEVLPGTRSIVDTVRIAPPGALVAVPAGVYEPFQLGAGDVNGSVRIVADVTGQLTGSGAGEVVINAAGGATAISLDGVQGITLDGFTVRNAARAGIEVRNSSDLTLVNLIVRNNTRDGIRIIGSTQVRVWNNLLLSNGGAGLALLNCSTVAVLNNTFYGNLGSGLQLGAPDLPASDVFTRNNIFIANTPFGIVADAASVGFDGNYNLNRDGVFNVSPGPNDLNVDPFWINPGAQDGFRIPATNDECLGGSAIMDAGDPNTDAELVGILAQRTTQVDNKPDCTGLGCCPPGCAPGTELECVRVGAVDLGYHYPIR